jgi:threonine synthase
MLGYQASGAAPFIHGAPVADPETVATAIRIGNPQSWELAQAAQRESNGWFSDFSDADILRVHRALAAEEGVFFEPASAISVAGALDDAAHGRIEPGSVVVCTVTGHGLKDPDTALVQTQGEVLSVAAELDAVRNAVLANL